MMAVKGHKQLSLLPGILCSTSILDKPVSIGHKNKINFAMFVVV